MLSNACGATSVVAKEKEAPILPLEVACKIVSFVRDFDDLKNLSASHFLGLFKM